MELRQLAIFAAAAREKSYSTAARKLFISHSTVSRAVTALEAELGVRLVARISNNVVGLTPAGEALYEEAVRLVELERAARARVIQIGKETEVEAQ